MTSAMLLPLVIIDAGAVVAGFVWRYVRWNAEAQAIAAPRDDRW